MTLEVIRVTVFETEGDTTKCHDKNLIGFLQCIAMVNEGPKVPSRCLDKFFFDHILGRQP